MKIAINLSAVREVHFHEYAVRFFFGGVITLLTRVIAKRFGPVSGGLFLAFPAILPASLTLVEKHAAQKTGRAQKQRTVHTRQAAGLDAFGASLGSIGLVAFAIIAWQLLAAEKPAVALCAATVVWMIVSALGWRIRQAL
jgi:hypothetical protein